MPALLHEGQPFPLVVMDLEWNQGYGAANDALPHEVLEIGAVRLGPDMAIQAEFSCVVKPRVHTVLHRHVRRVTGLSPEDWRKAPLFTQAYADFRAFCGPAFTLCTWGPDDYPVLRHNLAYWGLPHQDLSPPMDAQMAYAALLLAPPARQQTALASAMQALDIEQDRPLHRAVNDAYYTARVLQCLAPVLADMAPDAPRALALRAALDAQTLRCTACDSAQDTPYRNITVFLQHGEPALPACPACEGALAPLSPWQRPQAVPHMECVAACTAHGPVRVRATPRYDSHDFVCVHTHANLITAEEAASFAARCRQQSGGRGRRARRAKKKGESAR
jgi:inhibitor of KinA sporulation pathway (predicted exonuclease)